MVQAVIHYIDTPDAHLREQVAQAAGEQEHRADDVRRTLMQRLSETFVTPFDREDINELSRAIDDIADYAENTIKEIQLYEITPDVFIHEMVHTLYDAVQELSQAAQYLTQDSAKSNQHALRAKQLENKMEGLYRRAIAHFTADTPVYYLIKVREVYRHLSNAADRVDLAANVINSVIVKKTV